MLRVLASIFTLGWGITAVHAAEVVLVQSVPVETDLAVPGVADTSGFWLKMVNEATTSIDLEQFYVTSKVGTDLDKVIEALEAASKKPGMKIRILLSESRDGKYEDQATIDRLKAMKNTELRFLNVEKVYGQGIIHTKKWIIDGKAYFIGSQNFDWRALEHIHETGVWVAGDAFSQKQVQDLFDADWKMSFTGKLPQIRKKDRKLKTKDLPEIEVVASPPAMNPKGVRSGIEGVREMLLSTQEIARFTVMAYSPVDFKKPYWAEIDQLLRILAVSRKKVEIMVADWNTDKPAIDHLKSLSLIPGINIKIVKIPQASEGFIHYARVTHSKFLIIDNALLLVGTSNWSQGYFEGSRNEEVILRNHPDQVTQALASFKKMWESPCAELLDVNKKYVPPERAPKPKPLKKD